MVKSGNNREMPRKAESLDQFSRHHPSLLKIMLDINVRIQFVYVSMSERISSKHLGLTGLGRFESSISYC